MSIQDYADPLRIQGLAASWEEFDALPEAVREAAWTQAALEAQQATDGAAHVGGVLDLPVGRPEPPVRRWTPRPLDPRWQLDDIPPEEYVYALTGLEVKVGRRVDCPFPDHDDHSRDFALLRNGEGFCCYGCGRGGRIFQFAAGLWGYCPPLRGDMFREVRDRLLDELGTRT